MLPRLECDGCGDYQPAPAVPDELFGFKLLLVALFDPERYKEYLKERWKKD